MKTFTLFVFIFLLNFSNLSQNDYQISFEGTGHNENTIPTSTWWTYYLYMDSTNPSNIWQIGAPQKNIFSNAESIPNAIVTDTLNHYPSNDTSSFVLMHRADHGFFLNSSVVLSVDYFVYCDTLTDYGLIEFSPDNGNTWIDMINDTSYSGHIGDWLVDGVSNKPVLTGNSFGWHNFDVQLGPLGALFNIQIGDTVLWKFTFISDSIQTNKDGLMFDNLSVFDTPPIGINELDVMKEQLNIFPNPTSEYIAIEFNKNSEWDYTAVLYSSNGVLLTESKFQNKVIKINISELSKGKYYIKLLNNHNSTFRFGSFVKK